MLSIQLIDLMPNVKYCCEIVLKKKKLFPKDFARSAFVLEHCMLSCNNIIQCKFKLHIFISTLGLHNLKTGNSKSEV